MFRLVEIIGRYLLYLEFIPISGCLFIPKLRSQAFLIWLSVGLATSVGWLIKDFFYLPRPFIISGHPPLFPYLLDGSFPSNHTAAAVALAVSTLFINRYIGMLFMILAVFVAAGRILGGVHSYSDVLAGAFLGTFSAILINSLVKTSNKG